MNHLCKLSFVLIKLWLNGWKYFVGSTVGKISIEKCLDNIAEAINNAHSATNNVITGTVMILYIT